MKKIRYLEVTFENDIEPWEVPAFRGAIIATAGKEHVLFHNHDDDKFRYSYPLIQYKQIRKKPVIISLDQGIEEIHHFFENMQLGLLLGERPYELKIAGLHMNQITLQVWDHHWDYRITNWIALNQENYPTYNATEALTDKITMLENILKANILSFAKGIGWVIEKPVEVRIKQLSEPRWVSLKGKKVLGFNAVFSSNVFLPRNMGLGKSVSVGFGLVYPIKNQ